MQFQSCIIYESAVEGTEQIVFIVQMASCKSHFTVFCFDNYYSGYNVLYKGQIDLSM